MEAQVCRQEALNGEGAGTLWFVRLPDGYLLSCGFGFGSAERAADVARRLNLSYDGYLTTQAQVETLRAPHQV